PFIHDVLLQGEEGEATLEAVIDDGAMANALDEEAYKAASKALGPLSQSRRTLRMANGQLVQPIGVWSGTAMLGGVCRKSQFEVFPSGGAWTMLFGKPLLEVFGAWHGYEADVIVLRDGDTTIHVTN
ncbi:hypothetical protein C8R43DRAFT_865521, partial [Mycena crocata]